MKVYSYVLTIVRDSSAAEEITQQTFFRALSGKDKFRSDSGEFTWLCAIAKNLTADEYRRKSKTTSIPESDIESPDDIISRTEDRDMMLRIHIVLHSLEEPYKEVFSLRVFGELSFRDIGRIFAKTENWARVTFHRAKLKICDKITEENEGEKYDRE